MPSELLVFTISRMQFEEDDNYLRSSSYLQLAVCRSRKATSCFGATQIYSLYGEGDEKCLRSSSYLQSAVCKVKE